MLLKRRVSTFLRNWKRICGWGVIVFVLGVTNVAMGATAAAPIALNDILPVDVKETERTELRAIYEGLGGSLIWATPSRQLTLIKLLASLESDGIDVQQLGNFQNPDVRSQARADVIATQEILRAAYILAGGSTAPETIPGWSLTVPKKALVDVTIDAVRNDRLSALFDDLRPNASAYRNLRVALLRYLRLAVETWTPLDTSVEVHLDTNDARTPEVMRRLVLLGDLLDGDVSGDAVSNAVKHFQSLHGLAVDGRVGPATLAALNVSPAARAEQIAINLEYWRLLPRVWPKRYIAVNTAAARLELVNNGAPIYTSRVIVGDPIHPTPVMTANIAAVTFNPSWTIPRSIAVKEILPRLRRDPTYLERSNIEILDRSTDPFGLQLDWQTYSRTTFPFQLRQIPGPHNALGLVKFEMPNGFDVYLHDTPDRSLFEKPTRALSHGCIRVECANELAERLIDNPAVWLESDLSGALADGRTATVHLAQSLPVYLLYFTAYADENGSMNFRPDVYGRDAALRGARSAPLSRDPTAPHIPEGS